MDLTARPLHTPSHPGPFWLPGQLEEVQFLSPPLYVLHKIDLLTLQTHATSRRVKLDYLSVPCALSSPSET